VELFTSILLLTIAHSAFCQSGMGYTLCVY
jgi:hypothetical protein